MDCGVGPGPRPHLAGGGSNGPQPVLSRWAPSGSLRGARVSLPATGSSRCQAPAGLPGTPGPTPAPGTEPGQLGGPQNSLGVSVERLRQNHLGAF